ncbi:hypothetical protein AB0G74_08675 [Streptomyces sp. NPDC020875]|uniref:hypothetical protein n=1 Tax=Streptomyces sp. NPDC020875 TaxID=3154898 RepID=UPI0033EC1C73
MRKVRRGRRARTAHEGIWTAPITDVPLIAARWSLPQEAQDEEEAMLQRLRNGDFTGFTGLDDQTGNGQ